MMSEPTLQQIYGTPVHDESRAEAVSVHTHSLK